tara:strand:- start:681 stop:827 length:147 start_codon:yes stop_codon:yes gene_type:complete
MIIENTVNGLLISEIVNNQLIKRLYIGHSKKESIYLFNQYKKEQTNEI